MNFTIHSKNSAKAHGGQPSDYYKIHTFLDAAKDLLADARHRLFLHNTLGIHLCVLAFGITFKNSDGKDVSTAEIARQHVLEDLQKIPTIEECVGHLDKSAYAMFSTRIIGEIKKFNKTNQQNEAVNED